MSRWNDEGKLAEAAMVHQASAVCQVDRTASAAVQLGENRLVCCTNRESQDAAAAVDKIDRDMAGDVCMCSHPLKGPPYTNLAGCTDKLQL